MKTTHIKTKVYDSYSEGFKYPESEVPELQKKNNVGICFSGGGTRSASLTMGQLRGLIEIGVLDKIRYSSAVSGGSWGSVPFIYMDNSLTDEQLLGKYVSPEEITTKNIEDAPELSLTYAISNSKIFDDIWKFILRGNDMYSSIISDIFLKPFNIGNMKKFFTYNKESLDRILENNPDLTPDDFYLVNENKNRPFHIVNGTILRPDFGRYLFEMTPLYSGTQTLFNGAGSNGKYDIGGGFVETFGVNTDAPDEYNAKTQMAECRLGRNRKRFSLGDMIGTSGAAPAEYAERYHVDFAFPEFKYWSPLKAESTRAKEYDFGDGGILENFGIMPMLKRKVDRIIVFMNSSTPLTYDSKKKEYTICDSITALFKPLKDQYGDKDFDSNVVFSNINDEYISTLKALYNKVEKGEPAVYTGKYNTVNQPHYGIQAGHEVEVMWVYNTRVKNWVNMLPLNIKSNLEDGDYGDRFPNYKTFMENPPYIIDMKPEQVNLMAHQAAWNIVSNKEYFDNFVEGKSVSESVISLINEN